MIVEKNKEVNPAAALSELCRRDFFVFLKTFWSVIIPEEAVYNWHIEYLCKELQYIGERVVNREPKDYDLIINVPPGSTKSTIVTIMLPVWLWIRDPRIRTISGSYSQSISIDHAVKSRDVLRSARFKKLFPEIKIKKDSDNKSDYINTKTGRRKAVSVGSSVTGLHAHIIIIDDPVDPKSAESNSSDVRESANNWHDRTLSSRKVDKALTPTILVMQRLHESDLTGHLLKKKGKKYKHICLPAELSERVNPPELKDKYIDGLLDPIRINREVIEEARTDLGSYGYAGQYDQAPSPDEGGIIKKYWFKYIETLPEGLTWHFTIDPAYTSDDKNDPSALLCYAKNGNEWIIRSVSTVRMELPELINYVQVFARNNGYSEGSKIRIEPKASGKSLKQMLRKETALNVMESKAPTTDKIARARLHSPKIEAGRVSLVRDSWNDAFLNEVGTFPNATHDDQVDALVIALEEQTFNFFAQ